MKTTVENIDLASLPDEELLEFLDGPQQERVFSILYDRYVQKIYFKAISLVKNSAEAKDLSHDIFIKIFTKIKQYKGNSRLSLWIHSISVNTCINYLNKKKKFIFTEIDDQESELSEDPFYDRELKIISELKAQHLKTILESLNEEEKLLMIMKYTDGLSIKEMEEILGLSSSAVKMRLLRTREKIAALYEEKFGKYDDL